MLIPRDLTGDYPWDNMTPFNKFMEERPNDTGVSQYHFNTKKLNDFPIRKAEEMGCTVVDDEITDVVVSEWNKIESISSEKEKYEYDFYVDCTGFAKLLIGQLGARGKVIANIQNEGSYCISISQEDEISLWTLAKAMNAGWLFLFLYKDVKVMDIFSIVTLLQQKKHNVKQNLI